MAEKYVRDAILSLTEVFKNSKPVAVSLSSGARVDIDNAFMEAFKEALIDGLLEESRKAVYNRFIASLDKMKDVPMEVEAPPKEIESKSKK
jgi:hypothetical protein